MTETIQNNLRKIAEEQLINIQYTREAHLKCSHRLGNIAKWVSRFQIFLSAISTVGLITVLIRDNSVGTVVGTVCSALLFALSTYIKDKDLITESKKHIEVAEKLFTLREKYKLLLATFDNKDNITIEKSINDLVSKTEEIYKDAPSYTDKDYQTACKTIRSGGLSISNEERKLLLVKNEDNNDA